MSVSPSLPSGSPRGQKLNKKKNFRQKLTIGGERLARYKGGSAGVAESVDATDLNEDFLSALRETRDAELLKLGETSHVAIPSQAL